MPCFCDRDDGWPKKRCYVMKPPKYLQPHCRHWSKGITENGCGPGMWKLKAKDGSCKEITEARNNFAFASNNPKQKPEGQ